MKLVHNTCVGARVRAHAKAHCVREDVPAMRKKMSETACMDLFLTAKLGIILNSP